jgi:urease accessory protein
MKARAAVVAEAGPDGRTRLAVLRSQPPIMLRPTPGALYLAASAAGPLGGDELHLSVDIGPGARLTVRSVAAAVALPGAGGCSSFAWTLSVADGGRLAVLPEPTVVADGAEHRAIVRAEVAAGGALVLREEVLLGRHGERGGRHLSSVRVDAGGRPLLRSDLILDGADPVSTGPASAVGARACGSLLLVDPVYADRPPPGWAGPQATAMPLAGPGLLVSAVGNDAGAVRTCLDAWTLTPIPPPSRGAEPR